MLIHGVALMAGRIDTAPFPCRCRPPGTVFDMLGTWPLEPAVVARLGGVGGGPQGRSASDAASRSHCAAFVRRPVAEHGATVKADAQRLSPAAREGGRSPARSGPMRLMEAFCVRSPRGRTDKALTRHLEPTRQFETAHRVFHFVPHGLAFLRWQVSHHGIESTEGFSGDPHVLGSTGRSMGHRHGANLGVGKSGLTKDVFEQPGSAKAERSRLPRSGRRELRTPADDGGGHGPPTVSVGRGKDSDGDPTARS